MHGVTGSGKTEIYLALIQKTILEGRQAILLVPEIALTSQLVNIFVGRFGSIVSVTHSRLTIGERYDQWKRAVNGEILIMIGPRSAIFTPFKNIGIIIIDEEHENTYKSEVPPKYSAIETAIKRAELNNALVVLGSATPSIESYFLAETNHYNLVTIKERINKSLPKTTIVDMRIELEEGNRSMFSRELLKEIEKNVINKEQTILFLNRRGYSTFVSCRKCGSVLKCNECDVNYTYHIHTNKLLCHYCGNSEANPSSCLVCGSKFIKYFGIGTQKIEEEVKRYFPNINVSRMDLDTTKGKFSHEKIIDEFRQGKTQILIGTQMIAKGLDFPNVTLVGVVAADTSLNAGDYRCAEITYQLIAQVIGRSGRATLPGRAYIQTYMPKHYSIELAAKNNYEEFYRQELLLRKQMTYPPFTNIFLIVFSSENEDEVIKNLFKLADIINYYNKKGLIEILGPTPLQILRIKKRYRWKIIIKCKDEEIIKKFVFYCLDKLKDVAFLDNISINVTLNPTFLA